MPSPLTVSKSKLTSGTEKPVVSPGDFLDDYSRGMQALLGQLSASELLKDASIRIGLLLALTRLSRGKALQVALAALTAEQRVTLLNDGRRFLTAAFKGGLGDDAASRAHRETAGAQLAKVITEIATAKFGRQAVSATVGGSLARSARSTTLTLEQTTNGFIAPRKPSVGTIALDPFGADSALEPHKHFGLDLLPGRLRGPLLNTTPHDADERSVLSMSRSPQLPSMEELLNAGNKDTYHYRILRPLTAELQTQSFFNDLPRGVNPSHLVEMTNSLALYDKIKSYGMNAGALRISPRTKALIHEYAEKEFPRHTMTAVEGALSTLKKILEEKKGPVIREVDFELAVYGYAPLSPYQARFLSENAGKIFQIGGGNGFNDKAITLHGGTILESIDSKLYQGPIHTNLFQMGSEFPLDYSKSPAEIAASVYSRRAEFIKAGVEKFGVRFTLGCLPVHLNCYQYFPVTEGSERDAHRGSKATLLIVAPHSGSMSDGEWVQTAISNYSAAGGKRIAFIPLSAFWSSNPNADWFEQMLAVFAKQRFSLTAAVPSELPGVDRTLFIFEKTRK